MLTEKQIAILKELQEKYITFGNNKDLYPVFSYLNFYWKEITELATIVPYVVYEAPKGGNPMYEVGRHFISKRILDWNGQA